MHFSMGDGFVSKIFQYSSEKNLTLGWSSDFTEWFKILVIKCKKVACLVKTSGFGVFQSFFKG